MSILNPDRQRELVRIVTCLRLAARLSLAADAAIFGPEAAMSRHRSLETTTQLPIGNENCRRLSKFYESCGPGWSSETLLRFHDKLYEPLRQIQLDNLDPDVEGQVTDCLPGGDITRLLARLEHLCKEEPADVLSGQHHSDEEI